LIFQRFLSMREYHAGVTAGSAKRRLLLGPGPSNVHPRVLRAMDQPLLGHLDPAFLALLDDVQSDLRDLFGTSNSMTLPLSATGSAGMEACLCNLLESGDEAVIGVAGVFGDRMCDVATRIGARVSAVHAEPGNALPEDEMCQTIRRVRPRLVAFVHAETSTGVLQPVETIARAARDVGALVVLDCVTSLAGLPLHIDDWGIDAVYSATQKCLSAPPGLSPVSFSDAALRRAAERETPVQSWYLDVNLLAGYFGDERVYHHTAPISAIFALRAALALVAEEGMDARAERHRQAGAALVEGLAPFGFEPLVLPAHRLPMLTSIVLPQALQGSEEAKLRGQLLQEFGIEIGGGLGPLAGRIWRIGLMGENARLINVESLLCALRRVLT
jgi:alanine-glyoxylate transaminase/serine-glyoxylate transaminase/serine-pyruvate transaminase